MSGGREAGFALTAGLALSGLLIWSAHFVFIYGFVGLACARGWARPEDAPLDPASLAVLAATVAACAAVATGMSAARRLGAFLRWLALAAGALSLLAILWEGAAVFFVPACQ